MALKVHKFPFNDIEKLNHFLQGAIFGGVDLRSGLYALHGKTLVFNAPAGTVTFDGGPGATDQTLFSMTEIITQIEAQNANVKVYVRDGKFTLIHATLAAAVNLDLTGTANAQIGFSDAVDTVGKLYGSDPATPPALVSLVAAPSTYVLVTAE